MNKITAYITDSVSELKKVQWPSRQETIRLTAIVIGVSVGVGLFVTAVDYIFKELLTLVYF